LTAAAGLTMATGDGPRTTAIYEELVHLDRLNGGAWDGLGFAYMVFDNGPGHCSSRCERILAGNR